MIWPEDRYRDTDGFLRLYIKQIPIIIFWHRRISCMYSLQFIRVAQTDILFEKSKKRPPPRLTGSYCDQTWLTSPVTAFQHRLWLGIRKKLVSWYSQLSLLLHLVREENIVALKMKLSDLTHDYLFYNSNLFNKNKMMCAQCIHTWIWIWWTILSDSYQIHHI